MQKHGIDNPTVYKENLEVAPLKDYLEQNPEKTPNTETHIQEQTNTTIYIATEGKHAEASIDSDKREKHRRR